MKKSDGMNYAPIGKVCPVVKAGEFKFAAIGLDHGHIFAMSNGLIEAGAEVKWVYDADSQKMDDYCKEYPSAKQARSEDEIFLDDEVKLIVGAAIPNKRYALGIRAMNAGKDYFTDKTPFTELEQLELAKETVAQTGKKYMVYYAERIHSETGVFASHLIEQGEIGRVIQVIGMGPHRLGKVRPDWFYKKEQYGGILCDIGSHQIEQILHYTASTDATISNSQIANYNHPQYPELDDFGDANIITNNGASGYFRVDWFTPDGLQSWGDGRTFILGTKGFIEQRKYLNLGNPNSSSLILLANGKEETSIDVNGKVGYPFFGQLILDCINRTENAMTQQHAFKAAELCIKAQLYANVLS